MRELKKEIESASAWADAVFAEAGEILPMWAAVTAKDEHFIVPSTFPDKDVAASVLRDFFKEKDVVRYLFITEAWTCTTDDQEVAKRAMAWMRAGNTLEDFPDRKEILAFTGEDESGWMSAHREIIRGEGKPTLGPLQWIDSDMTEGRFVGMLPRRQETTH